MAEEKWTLRRVRLNRDGYEYGRYGQYFGVDAPLYRYDDGGEIVGEVRAVDREDAKNQVRRMYPAARFYR